MPKKSLNTDKHDFERGFFCAVAVLLRQGDYQAAESIFRGGGDSSHADAEDIEVFREYGLLPNQ